VEHTEAPTPSCARCGEPFWPEQAGQKYCSIRCREAAKKRRQRYRRDRGELLVPGGTTLPDVHDGQDDEAGLTYADDDQADTGYDPDASFHARMQFTEAIDAIRARYDHRIQPYLAQLRRNPGVRPPELVRLEQECDQEIVLVARAHEHARALDYATRNEFRRMVLAADRQRERAALHALASDLPGRSRRYTAPSPEGRATGDIWNW
jgi:hypothetical protein